MNLHTLVLGGMTTEPTNPLSDEDREKGSRFNFKWYDNSADSMATKPTA